jgi:phosphatidylglycerophosphate synthase
MANLLTALRLLLVLPMAWSITSNASPSYLTLLIVLVAIASDYFDGKVARARNTASPRGMLFDHGTDFVFVTSAAATLAYTGLISPLLPVLITLAFSQYVLDSYFLFKQKQLRMSFLGKWNGVFYFGPALLFGIALASPFEALTDIRLILLPLLAAILMLSTLASIADRTLAPLRRSN